MLRRAPENPHLSRCRLRYAADKGPVKKIGTPRGVAAEVRGGTFAERCGIAPSSASLSRVRPGRRRGARVAPARASERPPAPGRHPGARPGSRIVARAARCWSTSTTPPAASWTVEVLRHHRGGDSGYERPFSGQGDITPELGRPRPFVGTCPSRLGRRPSGSPANFAFAFGHTANE